MKLSAYAKQVGVTSKTAFEWWKAGHLGGVPSANGHHECACATPVATGVALYARVSSADQKDDVLRQVQRLRDDAAARGYQVMAEVTELASGL